VDDAIADGAGLLVGLVLAPHWSSLSIAKYEALFDDAAGGRVRTRFVREWGDEPGLVSLLAGRVRSALDEHDAHVVFTAHSLPARILAEGDTYEESLLRSSTLVAEAAGVGDGWSFAYQSESPTGEPWLGPDILDHLDALAGRGVRDVLACPVGFVSDHLEIGWDIDVEAVQRAGELGLGLRRIEMPNDDPALVQVLAGLVRRELAAAAAPASVAEDAP
jgi:ferrochelatase